MKKFVYALLAGAAMIGSAAAADLPKRAPAPSPYVPVPIFTWTGFYVGGNIGGAWNATCGSFTPSYTGAAAAVLASFPGCSNNGSFIGGLQGGYNWQTGNFVVGVEGDVTFASNNSNTQAANVTAGGVGQIPNGFYTVTGNRNPNAFGTLRLRLGYAMDRALFYVTGGVAFGNGSGSLVMTRSATAGGAAVDTWTASGNGSGVGWALGTGLEYAFTQNWTARLEYMYVQNGNDGNLNAATCVGTCTGYPAGFAWAGHRTRGENLIRVGVNYKFGGPSAPVVASY